MHISHVFCFSEGSLVIFRDETTKCSAGRFIASKDDLITLLEDPSKNRYPNLLRSTKEMIECGQGFTNPIPSLQREFDAYVSRYLLTRILAASDLRRRQSSPLGLDYSEPIVLEFFVFAGGNAKYVAVGTLHPNGEHSLAILPSIEDVLGLLEGCGIEGDEQYLYIQKLRSLGLPLTQPVGKQIFTWGDMAKVINFVAAAERARTAN